MSKELEKRYNSEASPILLDICRGRDCHECRCNYQCCKPNFEAAINNNNEKLFNDLLEKLYDAYEYHLGVNIKAMFVTVQPDEVLSLFGGE